MTLLVPGGDLRAVITALVDDELATVWSDGIALGWSSEALAFTDGKAISPTARSAAWIGRSASYASGSLSSGPPSTPSGGPDLTR